MVYTVYSMHEPTLFWWSMLCGVSAINVLAWVASTLLLRRRFELLQLRKWSSAHWHVILSAGYVLGCAYRSAFPVYDVQRLVMVDSWLSSVVVGRSIATIAELCFAAQWALLLHTAAQTYSSQFAERVSRWIVPLIAVAEICSWYAVLTTSNLGHVLEESIWGLSAAMFVGSFLFLWPRSDRSHRPLIAMASAFGLVYVAYMFQVDVPMYWARWIFDEGRGHQYLSIAQGLADVSDRWVVSTNWTDWESEVVWMSLYFSVAVWLSIGLMHVSNALSTKHTALTFERGAFPTVRKPIWFKPPMLR
jgi:hypothetical protein